MTIKEALSTKVAPLSIDSAQLDLALLEAGLDANGTYDPMTDGKAVDMVWIGLLLTTIQVTELREDDVSIKYSTDLKAIVSFLYKKWGMTDPYAIGKPKVTQKLFW